MHVTRVQFTHIACPVAVLGVFVKTNVLRVETPISVTWHVSSVVV